ncbi:MAG: hypothetical protein OXL39_19480 [Caldilineaceae bacterium]|nr:hypothetical protein [Caldilineaceae bacterium]
MTRGNEAAQSSDAVDSGGAAPSALPAGLIDRYELFSSFFDQLYLDREVFAHKDRIVLRWPRQLEAPADFNVRLQRSDGRIYAESEGKQGDSGDRILAQEILIPDGAYELVLMPSANEYYVKGVRIQRKIQLSVVRSDYRTTSYGTYVERQIELLRHAIALDDGLFSEIAKMTLGWWDRINIRSIYAAIAAVESYDEDHLARLLGLLGMVYRYSEHEAFPAEFRQPLDDCILGLPFDEADYAEKTGRRLSDTERLLLATAELLAGQHFPERAFPSSNQTGQWHCERGEATVARWLQRAAANGFPDTSGHSLANLLTALSYVIDLADSKPLWNLAGVVMDKTLVTLALDSYQGVYGASQIDLSRKRGMDGETPASSGYASPLAGVARLLWGIGAWNWHMAAPVSLACCQGYQQPSLIADLALDRPDGMWATERHSTGEVSGDYKSEIAALPSHTLHKGIYKTSDYLLASAQDFRPGERGWSEHSWQATLGAEAIVFANGPGVYLPRVAQHRDLLIALHSLPADDGPGFTCLYFPTTAFEEHQVGNQWALAAKGDAYIALACSMPFALRQDGPAAFRELRAAGREAAWLCQMGTRAEHGSFAGFRKWVLAARFESNGLSVSYRPLGGNVVSFGWNQALCINGEKVPLHQPNHYEGPHCVTDGWPATQMVVAYGGQAIQLDFASG